jgi:hypothetical protein
VLVDFLVQDAVVNRVTSTVLPSNVAVITSSALAGTFRRRWRAARVRTRSDQ